MIYYPVLSPACLIAMPGIPDRHGPDWVIVFTRIRN
jgi:hypothetical protein